MVQAPAHKPSHLIFITNFSLGIIIPTFQIRKPSLREEQLEACYLFHSTMPHSWIRWLQPCLPRGSETLGQSLPPLGWIRSSGSMLPYLHLTEGFLTLTLGHQTWTKKSLSSQAYPSSRSLRANRQILCSEFIPSQFFLRELWMICFAALARIFLF